PPPPPPSPPPPTPPPPGPTGGAGGGPTGATGGGDPSLGVRLFAEPSSGDAPLKNVDLFASVTSAAIGESTYKFDCTNDGTFERVVTSNEDTFRAVDLCSYALPKTYTAAVVVSRGRLNAQATREIEVKGPPIALSIAALGRNVSKNQSVFNDPLFAVPGDNLEFEVFIASGGSQQISGVTLRATLSARILYKGDVRVGDSPSQGNPLREGVAVGNLASGQTKVIRFNAQVAPASDFEIGTFALSPSFIAFNPDKAATDTVTVQVTKREVLGATRVPTGPIGLGIIAIASLLITILIFFAMTYWYLFRTYLRYRSGETWQTRAQHELARIIAKIRKREKIEDRDGSNDQGVAA
ncbi:MAG: hypothetical protein HYS52_01535, partial [Candidatus Wildermuthbacteria bacterium]|nr:hypothetical protein [Candidatus Wildermuthbacteria bacterium]